jgi:hypothetical protein
MTEMALSHELQSLRVTFDRACDIIFRLVERALGLGSQEVDSEEIRGWVQEAMPQTGGRTIPRTPGMDVQGGAQINRIADM